MVRLPLTDAPPPSPPDAKYTKKSHHAYKTFSQQLAVLILLPATATVTTDVWFQTLIVDETRFGYDFALALTNISGAFLDGFFSPWEDGTAVPHGPGTEALHLISHDMRAHCLSTYTSWAGMVGVSATLAYARDSVLVGIVYILLSVLFAFVAHGMGGDLAQIMSSSGDDPLTNNKPYSSRARRLLRQLNLVLVGYVVLTYVYIGGELIEDGEEGEDGSSAGTLYVITPTPRNQLVVGIFFSVIGAFVGNFLALAISKSMAYRHTIVPAETLCNNALFGLLALSLNLLTLWEKTWAESLVLRGFAINLCGAASLFTRHVSDNRRLYYSRKKTGLQLNALANMVLASMVFWLAFEMEELLHPSEDSGVKRRGRVVFKLMKILENRRRRMSNEILDNS